MSKIQKQNKDDGSEDYGEVFFNWKFPEFPKYHRDKSWYVWAVVVIVLLLLFSIFSGNLLFGLIVIMSALIILMFQRSDDEVEFKITEDGISINQKFYNYQDIQNFFIIYEPPEVKTLYFEPKSIISPRIPVALEDQDPVKIRELLLQYLDEDLDREDEPVSDQTSRLFKL